MVDVPSRFEFDALTGRVAALEKSSVKPACGVPGTLVREITFGPAGTYQTVVQLRTDFYKDWSWGVINREWERYTDFDPKNLQIIGNELLLIATPTRGLGEGQIDSACLISRATVALPAIVEFQLQMPRGLGMWPAGWLYAYKADAGINEIDTIESVYNQRDGRRDTRHRIFQNLHPGDGAMRTNLFDQWGGWDCGFDTAAGYHYYSSDIRPGAVRMYFDQILTKDQDFTWAGGMPNLVVNLACGSSATDWPGVPEVQDFQNGNSTMRCRSIRIFKATGP